MARSTTKADAGGPDEKSATQDQDLKFHLRVNGAHFELQNHLKDLEPGQRAERIRMLASLGLQVVNGRAMMVPAGQMVQMQTPAHPSGGAPAHVDETAEQKRGELLGRLRSSLEPKS
jgi:hypothetical protein